MMVFLLMTADLRIAGRNLVVKRSKRMSGSELGSRDSKREKDWGVGSNGGEGELDAKEERTEGSPRKEMEGERETNLLDASLDLHELSFVFALGADLAGDVGERLVEQRTDLGRLVGGEEDRLTEELGPGES